MRVCYFLLPGFSVCTWYRVLYECMCTYAHEGSKTKTSAILNKTTEPVNLNFIVGSGSHCEVASIFPQVSISFQNIADMSYEPPDLDPSGCA